MPKDVLLFNADVIPLNPTLPRAGWVAVRGGRIAAMGASFTQPPARFQTAEPIDCAGNTVLPGFIDPHLHVFALIDSLLTLDLSARSGITSMALLRDALAAQTRRTPTGHWIKAKGYHEFDLQEKRHPNRHDLDRVAPDHPIKLTHRSGHAHVLNSLGLQRVGITLESEDPEGGVIDRNPHTAEPTGILYEMGSYLSTRIPTLDEHAREAGVQAVNQLLLSHGITRLQDASATNDLARRRIFHQWQQKRLLIPHVHMALGIEAFLKLDAAAITSLTAADEPIRIDSVKLIIDETTGSLHPDQRQLNQWVLAIHHAGLQAVIHAIEPPAIAAACQAIERALRHRPKADHRHRIEHCSLCPPHLVHRIAAAGIRVVTQPGFIQANGDRYLATVPTLHQPHLYPIRSLITAGIKVAGSSDAPVARLDPMMALHAAVTRKTRAGADLVPNEAVHPMDALHLYTTHAAEALFVEGTAGKLAPGYPADMVVLNHRLEWLSGDAPPPLRPSMTLIGGEVMWRDH